jgi:hypothetical protein
MPLLSGLATGLYDVKIAVFLEDVPILQELVRGARYEFQVHVLGWITAS